MVVSQQLDRDSPHLTSTFRSRNVSSDTRNPSRIYQPPETPYSSAYASSSAFAGKPPENRIPVSRKRSRPDSAGSDTVTPISATHSHWTRFSIESPDLRSAAGSPPLFVNTRYTLKGGIDTPTAEAEARFDFDNDPYRHEDYRRRGSVGEEEAEKAEVQPPPVILGERNGRTRVPSSPNGVQPPSWGRFVVGFVGDVAGTMWEFCKATAFRGFYAGGGKGYEIPSPYRGELQDSSIWEDVHASRRRTSLEATPIPGQYPRDDYSPQNSSDHRPAKRLHTESGTGWVMVTTAGETETPKSTSRPPARRHSSMTGSAEARRSTAARPNLRRSLASSSRRSLGVNHAGSPGPQNHRRRTSNLTSRTPGTATPVQNPSPVSVDAQRYADRIRREEKKTDASIRRLNDQLKAMIKEGKEALASNVEVVEDEDREMEDEGFGEGVFGQTPVW